MHAVVSGLVSIGVGYCFRSVNCAVISFASGILIDIDHPIDYFFTHNKILDVKDMFREYRMMEPKKVFVALHSYELITLLWVAIGVFSLSEAWIALAIGFSQHLIFDQLTNPVKPFGYFFTYRALNNFDPRKLLFANRKGYGWLH